MSNFYRHSSTPIFKPADILLLNLSNWPGQPVYPYAFVQVSALARREGLSIVRWDGLGLNRKQRFECIDRLIEEHQPRVVAFTIRQADSTISDDYTNPNCQGSPKNPWFPVEDTQVAIRHIRQFSNAKIFVGGFTFTVNPVTSAEYLRPDFGIIGEPDEFITHFDEVLEGNTKGISNLLYPDDGDWKENPRIFWGPLDDIEYTEDIINEIFRFHGELELRNCHLADVPGLGIHEDSGRSIAIEISRGCPYSCAFCCEPKVKGTTLRLRNLDVIEAEIYNLLHYGLRYYWFVCSELNVTKDHVLELSERIIRINESLQRPIFWRSYFRPGKFSRSDLRLLLRSGLLLEQNGFFSDLSDTTLKKMREPYRAKHAIHQIKDLMELTEEPEFESRRQPRWLLWSWLTNPYATLNSIRKTLEIFCKEKLDRKFDHADGYPALRVYECLDHLPALVKQETFIVTRDKATPQTLIHPSFYYNHELIEHFGSIEGIHEFLKYAQETFLSRYYRMTRKWKIFAQHLELSQLKEIIASLKDADLETIQMPPWVEHPDLGDTNPIHRRQQAIAYLHLKNSEIESLINSSHHIENAFMDHHEENQILPFLLHAAFTVNRFEMAPVSEMFKLPIDSDGYPPASPFLTFSILIRFLSMNTSFLKIMKKDFSSKQTALFYYYLYAINIRLKPQYAFLALE